MDLRGEDVTIELFNGEEDTLVFRISVVVFRGKKIDSHGEADKCVKNRRSVSLGFNQHIPARIRRIPSIR